MEVTIHNVAHRANVSVSTASRILNGGTKGMRRDAARRAEQVLAAARELGYQPNPTARGLVMKRSFSIGFVGTELGNPVRGKLIETLRLAALDKGYNLLVSGVRHGIEVERALDNMLAQRVDGLILGNIQDEARGKFAALSAKGIRIAGFGQEQDLLWDSIRIDYSGLTRELTSHLIVNHGFRHIVYAGMLQPFPRLQGYLGLMDEAGLDPRADQWRTDGFSLESGRELALRMIAAGSRPEAIVCHNDLLAIGIIAGLRRLRIRVPEDIAVVGLDNIDMASYTNPTLTTAGVDASELAVRLFELLLDRIEDRCPDERPRLARCHETLFFRESCGCSEYSCVTLKP